MLRALGLPREQQNERSALTLLAVLDLSPTDPWEAAAAPLIGVTPIMEWVETNYGRTYAPNTRETFRVSPSTSSSTPAWWSLIPTSPIVRSTAPGIATRSSLKHMRFSRRTEPANGRPCSPAILSGGRS